MSCRMGCIVTSAITPQSEVMKRAVAIFWLVIPNVRDLPIYALLYIASGFRSTNSGGSVPLNK